MAPTPRPPGAPASGNPSTAAFNPYLELQRVKSGGRETTGGDNIGNGSAAHISGSQGAWGPNGQRIGGTK